jgi:acyl transferase domain-containing protein/surfactin synthase thioesterase subunit
VAIIGMACRFPGASHPRAFWDNLVRGVESVTFFSDEELRAAGEDADLLRHPHYVKAAPILEGHDQFDAALFGYSPREAGLMDPQHRLFLEVAWEAFEDAGYDPLGEKGVVGVYAGAGGLVSSYMVRLCHPDLRGQTGDLGHIGNDRDFLCSRVSFKLNLTGPSVNVQSACSTSLLAVHLACQGLVDGEADMALAGASVVRVPHIRGYVAEPGGIYSVDGHTRAFDARASGTLFGSGVAAVLLKPLAAALADGDHVYATIKGTAINNDGARKMSYTASTAAGQTRAAAEALAAARVDPGDIGYVECHGTATALGDPIEIQALTRAFAGGAGRAGSCAIGSVKSNVGHLEQCAGMAGLIKAALALTHGVVPPSLHYDTPNPRVVLDRSPFFVAAEPLPFPLRSGPRRAGVNSVGMGGTNAFVVLEQAPAPVERPPLARPLVVLSVSAPTEDAMAAQVTRVHESLAGAAAPELRDACATLNRGRHHFGHRFAAIGGDRSEVLAELDRFRRGERGRVATSSATRPAPVVFLFSGQGAQYPRMGEAIYRAEPTFRDAMDRCLALFGAAGIPLGETLFGDGADGFRRPSVVQPALFSLQVALTELWRHWGIAPAAVIGHSMGEFAAAVAAGACRLEDAVTLVAARTRLMEDLPEPGVMVAIAADLDTVRGAMPEGRDDLAVAAVNAPHRTVVAGSEAAVATLVHSLRQRAVPVAEVDASHAFHSPLMDPVLEPFETIARTVPFERPRLRWISTLTGEEIDEAPDAGYWRDQIRCPVRFRAAMETVAGSPAVFLEVGPGATLVTLGRQCVRDARGGARGSGWIPSLAPGADEWRSLSSAVRDLYLQGHPIRWEAFEPPDGRRVSLPTYPFQRRRWWLEAPATRGSIDAGAPPVRLDAAHPLLGAKLGGTDGHFETLLDGERLPFLNDHRVFRRVVLPTTAVLDTVMAAAQRVLGLGRPVIGDFVYERALTLPDEGSVWAHLVLETAGARTTFRLESTGVDDGDPWQVNVTGSVQEDPDLAEPASFASHAVRSGTTEIPPERFYRFLAARGLSYGPAFQGIVALWRGDGEAYARVALPERLTADGHLLHPAFLDACLHVYPAVVRKYGTFEGNGGAEPKAYVPIRIDAFRLYRSGVRTGWVRAEVVGRDGPEETRLSLDIHVYGDDGRPVALFRGVTIHETTPELLEPAPRLPLEHVLYRVAWREVPARPEPRPRAARWCILADAGGVGREAAALLEAAGSPVEVVTRDLVSGARALTDPAHFAALFQGDPDASLGVLYLWALDSVEPGTDALGGGACVGVLKALDLARPRLRSGARLWLVTSGAQGDGSDPTPPRVAQTPVWGLGRTAAQEYPDLWGGLIDLPPDVDARAAAQLLVTELGARDGEDQVALRAGARLAPRFVRVSGGDVPQPRRLREDATYWIAGGLGAIGLETAEALVSGGARHLLLTGRRAAEDARAVRLEKLRQGARVVVLASDIASETDVRTALELVRRDMPPLKGVIHAAAVFDDGVLANLTGEQLERVLKPKVAGAWLLSRATRDLDLDFFVLFSSVLSLWGGLGQAAYTAANSFLDGLAGFRRAAGLPATVFNWGPWADVGLAERWGPSGAALWKERGTTPLSAEVCRDVLLRCLAGGPLQVAVCDTSWRDFLGPRASIPPLFRELAPVSRPAGPEPEAARGAGGPLEVVQRHAGQVLGVTQPIPVSQPLNELGLDSLLAVSLANRLRQALNVPVPTALLLKGPSIADLVVELFPDAARADHGNGADGAATARTAGGGWLVFPRPNAGATTRLFCFPFAGGGAATFRPWTEHLDPRIELVAIEPPGRQTRISEPPIREMPAFVESLVPAMLPFLDKPFAVYGHCLGALTLFETVRALLGKHGISPVHVFVSGARSPDELHRHQEFETELLKRLLPLPGYSVFEPIYRQPDEVFAEAMLQFNVLATGDLLGDAELRRLILPVVRADFEMSSRYRYVPEAPWDVPITSLTGCRDSYVSPENARSWSRFTRRRFQLFIVDTEHFLVVDDGQMLIRVLNRELGNPF